MKRFFIRLLLLIVGIQTTHAQSELSLSLKQAQQLGLQNRFDVKANQFDIDVASQEVMLRKQAFLPDLRATANVSYHPQLQATLIPAGFIGVTEPVLLALGAKSISVYSLELRQALYNPTLKTEVRLAHQAEVLATERKRQQDIEVKRQICQAYLNVLLRQLQNQIVKQEEQRFREYFTLAEGRYKNGALIENEYLRAKLDYENARQQAISNQQDYDLSLVTFRYQVNVPATTTITLTDTLGAPASLADFQEASTTVENRTEVRQLQLEEQINLLQEQRQHQATLPVVSVVGNYSQQYLNGAFNYNYTDTKWWSPFNTIGLQVSLPLTGQFTNRTSVKQAHYRSLQTVARQQQERAKVTYEIQQSRLEISNAWQNVNRTKSSYELARQVYTSQQQQLTLGAFSYDSLLNMETSLITAERNYISAVYDFLAARLNHDVATGNL